MSARHFTEHTEAHAPIGRNKALRVRTLQLARGPVPAQEHHGAKVGALPSLKGAPWCQPREMIQRGKRIASSSDVPNSPALLKPKCMTCTKRHPNHIITLFLFECVKHCVMCIVCCRCQSAIVGQVCTRVHALPPWTERSPR